MNKIYAIEFTYFYEGEPISSIIGYTHDYEIACSFKHNSETNIEEKYMKILFDYLKEDINYKILFNFDFEQLIRDKNWLIDVYEVPQIIV